jgi:hypothetical protein
MIRLIALLACLGTCLLPFSARAALPDATRFSVVLELGNVDQARVWLDEGLDPNFEGALIGTGLMICLGRRIALMIFLNQGGHHRTNRFGETALMLAAGKSQEALRWCSTAVRNRTETNANGRRCTTPPSAAMPISSTPC